MVTDSEMGGFDADWCRAVAAAVLGDADAVVFYEVTSAERFAAVASGQVDVLFRTATHTISRDTQLGVDFGPVVFYDGQQVMARTSDGFHAGSSVADLDNAVVCANAGTTTEANIVDAANAAGIEIMLRTFDDHQATIAAFVDRSCDAVTGDGAGLVARRSAYQPDTQQWVIFPSVPLSREPLAPVYAESDPQFAAVVDWVVYATITAESNDIATANVDAVAADPPNSETARLLGVEGDLVEATGLDRDAFYRVVEQVGSYGEIFARNLTPVGVVRSGTLNDLWQWGEGGLIYAPPIR